MELKDGCELFLQHWEQDLEKFLIKRDPKKNLESLQFDFCGNEIVVYSSKESDKSVSKACQNVEMKADMPDEGLSSTGDQFRIDMGVKDAKKVKPLKEDELNKEKLKTVYLGDL